MEVNNKNFQDKLPLILEAIGNCDFYVIDGEFSGLGLNLAGRFHMYESIEERYQKIKFVCQNYIAWQFGLATFRYVTEENYYQCQVFTFSLFPRDTYISQRNFLFGTSALKFLSRNNFNFDEVIEGGIAFHHLSKQKQLLADVERYVVKRNPPSIFNLDKKLFIKEYCSPQVCPQFYNNFLYVISPHPFFNSIFKSALGVYTQKEMENTLENIKEWLSREEDSMCLGFSSSLVRTAFLKIDLNKRLGADGIEKQKFGDLVVRLTKTRKFKSHQKAKAKLHTEIDRKLGEDFQKRETVVAEKLLMKEFEAEMGFSRVVEGLIKSHKPLIGHNLIYDITFLYSMFIDDLPESYTMFKQRFHDCFPVVYDTKVLGHSYYALGHQTDLNSLYTKTEELLNCTIGIKFPSEFRNLELVKEEHSAGYDAFITGKLFISICKLINLKILRNPKLYMLHYEEIKKEKEDNKDKNLIKPEEPAKSVPSDPMSKLNELLANFKHGPNTAPKDKSQFIF